jgi:dihydroorotase
MTGLETALSVVQHSMIDTGLMSWADLADRMSYRPAAIGQIGDHGRPLEAGVPANLTLVDPAAQRTVVPAESTSLSRNTPFEGMTLPGRVVATFLRGTPTVRDGLTVLEGKAAK